MTPILFQTRDELAKIDLDKMVYAEADGNYVHMAFQNGLRLMVTISLLQFEKLIANAASASEANGRYIRIGRKYIVDRRYIVQLNLPKQTLLLSDLTHDKPIVLNVPREALKTLKQKMTQALQIKKN